VLLDDLHVFLQCKSKNEGLKEMQSLAISRFFLPGEAQFPLNAMYSRPANKAEEG
jgi:actin related protein 2/3 complex subunit 3